MAPAVSSFTYSIARAYPYPYFKWIVIVGGILVTALFTVINIAATGYVLRVDYTDDWNRTMNERRWFQTQPIALISNTQTSCQALDLQIGANFFTNKRNFRYTLDQVWQYEQSGDGILPLPSLSYTNNKIENCLVNVIHLQIESTSRTAEQVGWTLWGAVASASIRCSVNNSQVPAGRDGALGPTWFNLTVQYEMVGTTGNLDPQLGSSTVLSEAQQSITWWGRSLMEWYWLATVQTMDDKAMIVNTSTTFLEGQNDTQAIWNKGSITIPPQNNENDITNVNFFGDNIDWRFVYAVPGGTILPVGTTSMTDNVPHSFENLIYRAQEPNIWQHVNNFARSFYSTTLADLGQQSGANILLSVSALEYFTRNFSAMTDFETYWLQAGPARSTFEGSSPITIDPSYIYTHYLCQIPKLKSNGALFIAVLIADLVFLQVAWKLLTWITTILVERSNPQAHFAVGCLMCAGNHGSVDLEEITSSPELVNHSEEVLGSPRATRFGPSNPRTGFNKNTATERVSMLGGTGTTARSTWHARTLSTEGMTTSIDSGVMYSRID